MSTAQSASEWDPAALVTSGPDGGFRLDVPAGEFGVTAVLPGSGAAFRGRIKVERGGTTSIDLVLTDATRAVRGRVLDVHGRPAGGVLVAAARRSTDAGDVFFARAGTDGSFALVVPRGAYTLRAATPTLVSDEVSVEDEADSSVGLTLEPKIDPPAPPEVVDWLRRGAIALDDGATDASLAPRIEQLIGQARVVALGEAVHGAHEFAATKARLYRLLAEQGSFRVLAMEVGHAEALAVDDYVVNGTGDPSLALSRLRFWITDTDELYDVVRWMRSYNQDPKHGTKLRFVGFDMQLSPTTVARLIQYLVRVDPAYARQIEVALAPLGGELAAESYRRLPADLQSRAHDAVQALVARLVQKRADYVRRASEAEWSRARELATILTETEALDRLPATETNTLRDRFMADNIVRFVRAQPDTRVVVWAANQHVAVTPYFGTTSMGAHLRSELGADYFSVGFAFRQGSFNAVGIAPPRGLMQFAVTAAPENTVEGAFARVGRAFVVGVHAPAEDDAVATWLSSRHRMRQIGAAYGEARANAFWRPLRPARGHDAMLFVDAIAPSHLRHTRPFFVQPTLPEPRNLGFDDEEAGAPPAGWSIPPSALDSGFRAETAHEGCRTGRGCAVVSRPGKMLVPHYGALSQEIGATAYRGSAVRVRAAVRWQRSAVPVPFEGAILWIKALDAGGATLAIASTVGQPIVSGDWASYEVSCELPPRASRIRYGVALEGDGRVWLDDVSVERAE